MHAILPSKLYALVSLTVAIPIPDHDAEFAVDVAADGINCFLNNHLIDHNFEADEGLIADWSIGHVEIVRTGLEVEEGAIFNMTEDA